VFSVTRLTGDMLSGEAGLIADSAAAIPVFGDRRLVLVKGRGTELVEACKVALAKPLADTIIIVEASETTTKHAIVKLFETSKTAASIGCYADNIGDIRALATSIFATDQVTASRDALDIIVERLGSDRASSRSEIAKLALMAGPGGKLEADDVRIALGDSALLAIDDMPMLCQRAVAAAAACKKHGMRCQCSDDHPGVPNLFPAIGPCQSRHGGRSISAKCDSQPAPTTTFQASRPAASASSALAARFGNGCGKSAARY